VEKRFNNGWNCPHFAGSSCGSGSSAFRYANMKPELLLGAFLLVGCQVPAASESVDRMSGWVSFSDYKPQVTHEFNDLPTDIRSKANLYLSKRLGPEFAKRLSFFMAQIVDERDLLNRCPTIRSGDSSLVMAGGSGSEEQYMAWVNEGIRRKKALRIHAFDLHYHFEWPEKGIGSYAAAIKMDTTGRILWDIDLPTIHKHPNKAKIISLEEAKKIATANRFDLVGATSGFDYSRESDSFVWHFTRVIEFRKAVTKYERIVISADSSRVLKKYSFDAYST